MLTRRHWDVIVMGVPGILGGLLYFLDALEKAVVTTELPRQQSPYEVLMQALGIESSVVAAVCACFLGCLSLVGGYGIIRIRAYGWWLTLLKMGIGVSVSVACFRVRPFETCAAILGVPVSLAWLICRIPLYRPFVWRREYENALGARTDTRVLIAWSIAVALLVATVLGNSWALLKLYGSRPAFLWGPVVDAVWVWIISICAGLATWTFLRWAHRGSP